MPPAKDMLLIGGALFAMLALLKGVHGEAALSINSGVAGTDGGNIVGLLRCL